MPQIQPDKLWISVFSLLIFSSCSSSPAASRNQVPQSREEAPGEPGLFQSFAGIQNAIQAMPKDAEPYYRSPDWPHWAKATPRMRSPTSTAH